MYTPKDFIDVTGKPFDKWMLEAVERAKDPNNTLTLSEIADEVSGLPQFKQHEMRSEPCPVFINLDDEGEDREYLVENKRQVVDTITRLAHLPTITEAAVMPDACSAGEICVGGVVAAKNAIHPAFHSADVCCSMFMSEFEGVEAKEVLDAAEKLTHFGPIPRAQKVPMPDHLRDQILSNRYTKDLLPIAERDFATQGDGNHFLFVGTRESTGNVSMVTHHGSRGFGARLFKIGMKLAQGFAKNIAPRGMSKQSAWIPMETREGHEYWHALQIVREWTYHNHMAIHDMVKESLDANLFDRFWNEHNFVFRRGDLYYHAKGATPGWLDTYDKTLVPMNMAEPVLITRGTETPNGIGFLPHGAGRNMSRTVFKRRFPDAKIPENVDVRSYCGPADPTELPQAYKSAKEVQDQMERYGLAETIDRVWPYGCIMAGEIEEPWRKRK